MPQKQRKSFKIVTLGCRTNQYESQAYQDQLAAMGYSQAQEDDVPEICIVNTCTVTESADASSRHQIRQLAKRYPKAKLVVTGCSADRQPDAIAQLEGVDLVVPNKEKEKLLEQAFPEEKYPEFSIKRFEAHTRAFVKVQDGCNSFCSYCIIPYVRGRSRSRTIEEIVQEVQTLVENGYKEVVITGINVGDFDGNCPDAPKTLADLMRSVDAVPGLRRLRLSSIDPDEVDDDLADAILNGKHTCKSMHIVLQSGSNVVLKRMNRKYTRQIFFDTVERMRSACPDFTFTTDLIVGFPGETEADHRDTLDAIKRAQFAKVHMFPYSDRPRTKSALMPNKVHPDVIRRRKQEVMRHSEKEAFSLREQFIGREMTILTESGDRSRPEEISGHTDNFLPVWIPREGRRPNELINVKLKENAPDGFIGEVIA
ncbi:MAG: tRNA (N(6)-L-threonylcarbamoyladenosine(37)-C(2))-methylthiotransferase MtaB [Chlamydiales bacterium]|nr:tRNA (N(6)-L-threonylcarbamoyladenosine(37)-C(2))-methylthiotransferase MtaB [Chlamydiia bacterium]MCP5508132.1 tRNA (N(6)-L-threonylcarbamoyladenosine(37)-C(2))-methylthiotransferase MtaB [Chlamydiales bacterium]